MSTKKPFEKILSLAVLAMLLAAAQAGAQTPDAGVLVRRLEKIMFPDAKAIGTLHFKSNKRTEDYEMIGYTRDRNQKIIVRITAPASSAGNDILMMDQNVWTYDKTANRVMKIASNQSFGGTGFSYGDVVRLNFSDNYDAAVKSESSDNYELELIAKSRNAPYYRIVLKVDKQGGWPAHGVYYTRNGSVVKTVEYSDIRDLGTGLKPCKMTVSSPLEPGNVNVLIMKHEESKNLPDRIFNKRNLETRLEEKF